MLVSRLLQYSIVMNTYCAISVAHKIVTMNEDFHVCADSSSENRSEIWSVSSHEPSPSDILFLSSSSGGEIESTASTSPIIFLDATPPSPIHCEKDASPIACSTPKMCCPKRCLQQHLEQAADINASFQRRNQRDQTQFLLDMFHVTKGGSTHLVNGEKVCRNAFLAVYGISRRRYQQVLKEYLRGSIKALRKPTSRTITTTVSCTYRIFYPKETFITL